MSVTEGTGPTRIGVVTSSRADYGILRPVVAALEATDGLEPVMLVTGTHLSPLHGETVAEIERDGRTIGARIEAVDGDTSAAGLARAGARAFAGLAETYAKGKIDAILVLGDRFEILAAVAAAVPFDLPIAHIHGGEVSFGAIDDACRHAITKLAHLHFPATEAYAARIRAMGEENWRITVSGAPGLDSIAAADVMERGEIEQRFGISLEAVDGRRPVMVTYHPVTREAGQLHAQLGELEAALMAMPHPLVMTGSNVDTGGAECSAMLRRVAAARADAAYVESFGSAAYLGALRHVGLMLGNSSSGIVEAASYALPVVNVGNRQEGRDRGRNVIDCATEREAILGAVREATEPDFLHSLQGMANPYGDGRAAPRIARALAGHLASGRTEAERQRLLAKRFEDRPGEAARGEGAC